MKTIKRVVSYEELCSLSSDHWRLAELSVIFQHEVVAYDAGDEANPNRELWNWKENNLFCWMLEKAHAGTWSRLLQEMAIARHQQAFTSEEYMKYYMQIGYNLSGFLEIFADHEATEYPDLRPLAKVVPEDHNPNEGCYESVVDYMIRVHKGKILKL